MKLIVEIPDTKQGQAFLKSAKALPFVTKAARMTSQEIAALDEAKEDQHALGLAAKLKAGKLKTRPARDLLDEL